MSDAASSSTFMTTSLLSSNEPTSPPSSPGAKHSAHIHPDAHDATLELTSLPSNPPLPYSQPTPPQPRPHKHRYLALTHLALLNIVVSWSWLTFAPISPIASSYFAVPLSDINWLSTVFLFAFVAATPATLYILNRYGPTGAIRVASVLIAVGSWVRYAGARIQGVEGGKGEGGGGWGFGVVVAGQVMVGLAQPFVLSAPVRFSEVWFEEGERIAATAIASLANPLGGAVGQIVTPLWATTPSSIPTTILYISLISTLSTLPTLLLPSAPRSTTTTAQMNPAPPHPPLTFHTFRTLLTNPSFPLLALPFSLYTSLFNATSSLLIPLLTPYPPLTETTASIAGALLILTGLLSSALTSPILDSRPQWRLPSIKLLTPVIAASYVALCFVPATGSVAGVYVLFAVLGAASFSLVPLALESLVDVGGVGVGAEVSSTVCWAGGQAGGAVCILVMDALRGGVEVDGVEDVGMTDGDRRGALRACVFQAILAVLVMPLPLCLGIGGTGREIGRRSGGKSGGAGVEEEEGRRKSEEGEEEMLMRGHDRDDR